MSLKRVLIVSLILIMTAILVRFVSHSDDIKLDKPLSTFPKEVGEWTGKEAHFEQSVYDILGVDDSYLAYYYNREERNVQIYIGYYQSQREGEQIHSPKNCMPGGGWNIKESSLEEISLKGVNPGKIKVIKLLLEKDEQKQIVFYWYQGNGRFISSEYSQRLYMVIDSMLKHRTNGSFVRLITPVLNNDEEDAIRYLKNFAADIIPVISEYIP
jgi:EpsI family protein